MVVRIGTAIQWQKLGLGGGDSHVLNPAGTVTVAQGIRHGLSVRGMIVGPGGLLSTASGGGLPLAGGVVLSLADLNALKSVSRGRVVAEPGAILANMQALARYAAICQANDIVPIVEPEVLMDGGHDQARCYEVTEFVLKTLYNELYEAKVFLEGTVLKPNMIVPGKKSANQVSPEQVAAQTIRVFKQTVPVAVPGIAFLSGGQSDVESTANLDAINKMGPLAWNVTFSYGRALQAAPQKAWSGKEANVAAGQKAFSHRAKMNSLASKGEWSKSLEG
jgi:hypothetical protein